MFNTLLIATDGSELGNKALAAGLDLAKLHGAKITIMTASDPVSSAIGAGGFGSIDAGPILIQLEERYAEEAQTILAAAAAKALEAGITAQTLHVPQHRPADAIVQTATELGCDTIIMGSHGRRGFQRLLLGSQAAEVLARASVAVLIVK
ncbi:universal stress protein [Devosia beringensis]|uniref:universal stress protein n=1 Tax=Devosia beringensis TaxID=2657486 RepID=UPI00186BA228|nr:universal stress protein [Devosia beringensis]